MAASEYRPLPVDDCELEEELNESFKSCNSSFGLMGRQKILCSMKMTSSLSRSGRQCSILLVGSTGVGKSSTANHLFNLSNSKDTTPFAKVNAESSETRHTKEYLIRSDSHIYKVSNLTVGIIDTPGFQDTGGNVQDACNMFSIKKFFKTHPRLANTYPNLIFVCLSATDVRYAGETSNFTKSLKCLRKLNVIDDQNPNVITIITKVCSLRPDFSRDLDGWKAALEKMKTNIRDIIFAYLHVRSPIVILENLYEVEQLARGEGADCKPGDFTLLPNGEQQPLNLFLACRDILKNNRDTFAEICLNACFMSGDVKTPDDGVFVPAKNASEGCLNNEEEVFVNFFVEAAKGDTVDPLVEKAEKFISEHKLNEEEKDEIQEIVSKLKRLSIRNFDDLKKHSIQSVRYHISNGSILSKSEEFLKFLNVPDGDQVILDQSLSCGYNIFIDQPTQHKIFVQNEGTDQFGLSSYPNSFVFEKAYDMRKFEEIFENEKAFIMHRHSLLHINVEVDPSSYTYHSRPGFTLLRKNLIEYASLQYSRLFEYRQFRLKFDSTKCSLDDLTDEFKQAVKNLPSKYRSDDKSCRSSYGGFIDKFGHYFIAQMYGGGSVHKSVNINRDPTVQPIHLEADVADVVWRGGNVEWHDWSTFDDSETLKKWQASIMTKPVLLNSEMKLEPISTAVGICDKEKMSEVQSALNDLLKEARMKQKEDLDSFVFVNRQDVVKYATALENVDKVSSIGAHVVEAVLAVVGFCMKLKI